MIEIVNKATAHISSLFLCFGKFLQRMELMTHSSTISSYQAQQAQSLNNIDLITSHIKIDVTLLLLEWILFTYYR